MVETTKKRITRKRTTTPKTSESVKPVTFLATTPTLLMLVDLVDQLLHELSEFRETCKQLDREITETKQQWKKEQEQHERELIEQNQQEEIARKREEETYQYEIKLSRKRAEDEFTEKKLKWERDLSDQKDQLGKEKEELEMLRKQVTSFEDEKEKLKKDVSLSIQKELTAAFSTERKLREQEVKAEKDLLTMKITTLTSENQRLNQEIARLKSAFDQATREVKDIAVRVIDSQRPVSSPESQKSNIRE